MPPQLSSMIAPHFCTIWTKLGISGKMTKAMETAAMASNVNGATIPYVGSYYLLKVTAAKMVMNTAPTVRINTIE